MTAEYVLTHINNEKIYSNRIDLVMIDLDLSNFVSRQALDKTLIKTRRKIKDVFGMKFETFVLWSGNGYHLYIPIESRYILEETSIFSKFDEPSKKFLRFAERYLSSGKADSNHFRNVSFQNCMLRIPGSYNSKCVAKNNGLLDKSTQIKVISQWNGRRFPIYSLIDTFYADLLDAKRIEHHRKVNADQTRAIYLT